MKIGEIGGTTGLGGGPLPQRTGSAPEVRHAHDKVVHDISFLAPEHKPYLAGVDNDEDDPRQRRRRGPGFPRRRCFSPRQQGNSHPALEDDRYRRVFPLRDRENQLHVHPELADPCDRTKVDPALRLLQVTLGDENAAAIRQDIAAGLFPGKAAGTQGLTMLERETVAVRFRMLVSDLHCALEKAMKGEEPVLPEEVYARTLTDQDLAPGESALKGQYGLFNRKNAKGKWRSVTEGRFLCFFSGFYCRTEAEYEAECARYPREEIDAYALVIDSGDYPCICPYQGGDLGQFANSAIRQDANGRPVEDKGRTNARFARADLILVDHRAGRRGERLVYPVVFLYMLPTPAQDGQFEREARVWYGQAYWDSFEA